jgi:uncharacterized protein YyaL (SSP411 family)
VSFVSRLLPLGLVLASCGGAARRGPVEEEAPPIAWQPWGPGAFEAARAANKIVIADIGIEGCTACRWMYEDTYEDPAVRARIAESFVAIQVDADVQPDLGERFARWGWPATIFFAPDGTQVLAVQGNKRPRSFLPILDELVARHRAGTLREGAPEVMVPAPIPETTEMGGLCSTAIGRLDAMQDAEHGGWAGPQVARGPAAYHALVRSFVRDEPARRAHAMRTVEGFAQLLDPVWGGTFVGARERDWSRIIPEKRTAWTLAAMDAFVAAYRQTGDRAWLDRAREVDRYLRDQMLDPAGLFYATQEDRPPEWEDEATLAEYYALGDAERRRYGVPQIDHALYTDVNAIALSSYVMLFEATLDPRDLAIAARIAVHLVTDRIREDGVVMQSGSDDLAADRRMRGYAASAGPYLRTQALAGRALLDAFRVTQEPRFLDRAVDVARALERELADENGGYFTGPALGTEAFAPRGKSMGDNAEAALFLDQLAVLMHDDAYRARAESALRAAAALLPARGGDVLRLGELALALEWHVLGPVEVSIVAEPADTSASALRRAAMQIYEPRKVLRFEPDGRYPRGDRPAVYVCTRERCSSPVYDADRLEAVAADLRRADEAAACGTPER